MLSNNAVCTSEDNILFWPLGTRVLVRKDPEEKVTSGGIHIPDTVFEKRFTGTVISTGPGRWNKKAQVWIPLEVKIKDRVTFPHYVGHAIKVDGIEYTLIKEDDLLGIIVDD